MEDDADGFVNKIPTTLTLTPNIDTCSSKVSRPVTMGFPNEISCTTPVLDPKENDLLKRQHTLHTYDSGFSDWTPESLPSCSSSQTTETPLISAVASPEEGIPNKAQPQPLVFGESPVQIVLKPKRRSWPLRTRRLSFQSPDSPQSPEKTLSFHQHRENITCSSSCLHTAVSQSCEIFKQEEEISQIMDESTSVQAPLASILRLQKSRSRSSSRSTLSSASDELEGSFQEMSLEESSSNCSSNQHSPTHLSSSPVFTFKDCQNIEANRFPDSTQPERKLSCLSWGEEQSTSSASDLVVYKNKVKDDDVLRKLDSQSSSSNVSRINLDPSFTSIPVSYVNCKDVSSSRLSVPSIVNVPSSSLLSTCATQNRPPSYLSCKNIDSCVTSPSSLFSHALLLKSPTKRTSLILPSTTCHSDSSESESVSPLKMRRLKKSASDASSARSKRELFSSTVDSTIERNNQSRDHLRQTQNLKGKEVVERVPQFLSLQAFEAIEKLEGNLQLNEHCNLNQVTPLSWKAPDQRKAHIVVDKESEKEDESNSTTTTSSSTYDLIHKVCLHFSPANPSQLIGRRVGVQRLDILGELHLRGFGECVKIILSHLADADLMRIPTVCDTWKSALFTESKTYRRFKSISKKMNSPRKLNLSEKENAVGKGDFKENVSKMTLSKGHLMAIQPQLVCQEHPVSTQTSQNPELSSDDCLRNCPHCQSRALILPGQDRAICRSEKCAYDFCTKCFFSFHRSAPCKPLFQTASKNSLVGTKQSKRNLRRL